MLELEAARLEQPEHLHDPLPGLDLKGLLSKPAKSVRRSSLSKLFSRISGSIP